MRDEFRALFEELDTAGNGLVSWDVFSTVIDEDVTVKFMNTLDLNKEDCRLVFLFLDDSAEGLTHDEFYEAQPCSGIILILFLPLPLPRLRQKQNLNGFLTVLMTVRHVVEPSFIPRLQTW